MTTRTRTIKDLVDEMYEAFKQARRADDESYWRLRNGSPEWISDIIYAALGDRWADDWRYEFIVSALCLWHDSECASEEEMRELINEIEPDVYTSALTRWLASDNTRAGYCDDFAQECGFTTTVDLLTGGQREERQETTDLLLEALAAQARRA